MHSSDPEDVNEGLRLLREYAEEHRDDAIAWFQYGSGLDFADHEAEAIVAYQRVFELGVDHLDPDDRPRIHVQAGSTLRNLGRLDEARSLLESGCEAYPGFRALMAFLALVEVSAGRERKAIDLLLEVILGEGSGDDSIGWYKRALTWYAEDIRSVAPDDTALPPNKTTSG